MIFSSINLLPPEKKEELKQEVHSRRFAIFFVGSLLIMAAFFLLLFSIKQYIAILHQNLREIVATEESSASNVKVANIEEEIKKLNKNIALVRVIYGDQGAVMRTLQAITESMPSGIRLSRFTYRASMRSLTISGFAPTRVKFLLFTNALKEYALPGVKEPLFAGFSSQVPYLAQQADIEFDIAMKIRE